MIETWRRHYDQVRPHSSLKDLTPIESKTRYDSTNPGAILKVAIGPRIPGHGDCTEFDCVV